MNYFLALIPSIAYSITYAMGGRDKAPLVRPRIWRRFIAPLLFSGGVVLLALINGTFRWPMTLSLGTYVLAMFIQKYGGDTLWQKVLGRTTAGLIVGLASLPIALSVSSYVLFAIQVAFAVLAHLALGLTNPIKAPYEEALIAILTTIFVGFMVI